MSLPPGFLDELRNRSSLARVAGRKLTWDQRKSNQGKGDLWAPCPFHQEKSASFHVDDQKGYFYCFGCHEKGDVISFVQKVENLGFMEAIEYLAKDAGMTMPARDPGAQQKQDRAGALVEAVEAAVQFYRLQLKTAGAAEARAYLERRGLKPDAQARFEIGFAPEAWRGLADHLAGKGMDPKVMLEAGLVRTSDKAKEPYDTFRNRIIFPIRDGRGRAIGFGGRAMDPGDKAKYINSPETPLFDKGRSLYNHGPARAAAGKGQPLIVAEGYMDVIALSEAGFQGAVAPLGTAVTESQLELMWRMHPEPVIALDGDTAGIRAARRVIDLALPLLEAGRSLRFVILPEGQDPDELIKAKGPEAMQALLDGARPMVQLLWERETEGKSFDSPERKAMLDKDLRACLKKIRDPSIRGHYGEAIAELRRALFRPAGRPEARGEGKGDWTPRPRGGWKGQKPLAPVLPTTRASLLAALPEGGEVALLETQVLAVLVARPELVAEVETRLERVEITDRERDRVRWALLRWSGRRDQPREVLEREIGTDTLEMLLSARHLRIAPALRPEADVEIARACLSEELTKLTALSGARREVDEAVEDIDGLSDEGLTWRLRQAVEARNRAIRAETEDRTQFDIAPSGARISRDEKAALDGLLDQIRGRGRSPEGN